MSQTEINKQGVKLLLAELTTVESPIDPVLPDDYEPCGDCGYDHSYEYTEAQKWHRNNPCSYCSYENEAHDDHCPVGEYLRRS